jgi:hypothetical protein
VDGHLDVKGAKSGDKHVTFSAGAASPQ